jgi:hypothetical protein
MKRIVVVSLVLTMAGSAYAERIVDPSEYTLSYQPLPEFVDRDSAVGWSNIALTGNTSYIQGTATCVGYEDYQTDPTVWGSGPTFTLEVFRFVGGVSNPNEIIWFNFYDQNTTPDCSSYYDYIGAQFGQAGNWIWTITLTTPRTVYTNGYVEMQADSLYSTTTGTWFLDDDGPDVGTSNVQPHGPYTACFELEGIPEPASLLLLGMAGLLLRRR